ncbi:NAD-dependent epimerase/dehydratase family protein [soil metagenome]
MTGPVAITGSTGFAGSAVVGLLERQGIALRLLMRKPSAEKNGNAEIVGGDLGDRPALARLMQGASAVIHIAGAIAAPNRAAFFETNAAGTLHVAQAAAKAGVKRFIHVSSLAAREPGLSDYGASKREAEDRLRPYKDDFEAVILRPPAIYGPGDRATLPLFAQMTKRIAVLPGTPQARFSLLYVEDFARLILAALDGAPAGLHEIDDETPGGYSWPELLAIAAQAAGHPIRPVFLPRGLAMPVARLAKVFPRIPLTAGKVNELYHADWVARRGSLGIAAPVRFMDGLPRTLSWYRDAGWLPRRAAADKTAAQTQQGERTS